MKDFVGAKIALINDGQVLITQRDNKPGLSFADMWEFPGGARDGNETPEECIVREVREELGIDLDTKSFMWKKVYPSVKDPSLYAYFFAANIVQEQIDGIVFGDEGQGWKMAKFDDVLDNQNFIELFKGRLQDYLDSVK